MAATALDMVLDLSESIPQELWALLIHLSRTTPFPLILLRPQQKCFAFKETLSLFDSAQNWAELPQDCAVYSRYLV